MSKTLDDISMPSFLNPLQGRHTRSDAVTAQIAMLSGLSRAAVLRRAAETETDKRLERETLVALVRGFLRTGDRGDADAVLLLLIKRVSSALAAETGKWDLTPEDRIDAQRQMIALLCDKACDLRLGAEFWECNFTTCFQRRLITIWHTLTDHALPTASNTVQVGEGETLDRLEQYADPAETFRHMEMESLVKMVSGGSAKRSEALFLKLNGFTDEDVAKRLKVTSRTLRNWTTEACAVWVRVQKEAGDGSE